MPIRMRSKILELGKHEYKPDGHSVFKLHLVSNSSRCHSCIAQNWSENFINKLFSRKYYLIDDMAHVKMQ